MRQADDWAQAQHENVMFRECRRVIHPSTAEPEARQASWGGERLPSWRDARERLRGPFQVGCGGRVFWQPAEPKFWPEVGYVGTCSHCGWQVFTLDLLRSTEELEWAVAGSPGDLARAERGLERMIAAVPGRAA